MFNLKSLSKLVITVALTSSFLFCSYAQAADIDIDVNSPAIQQIKSSMQARFQELAPLLKSGAVGLTPDGLMTVRDPSLVPLAQRQKVNALVSAENKERDVLYAEIAKAQGHPEWETDIRNIFAQKWVEKAQAGWFYKSQGEWHQK